MVLNLKDFYDNAYYSMDTVKIVFMSFIRLYIQGVSEKIFHKNYDNMMDSHEAGDLIKVLPTNSTNAGNKVLEFRRSPM